MNSTYTTNGLRKLVCVDGDWIAQCRATTVEDWRNVYNGGTLRDAVEYLLGYAGVEKVSDIVGLDVSDLTDDGDDDNYTPLWAER